MLWPMPDRSQEGCQIQPTRYCEHKSLVVEQVKVYLRGITWVSGRVTYLWNIRGDRKRSEDAANRRLDDGLSWHRQHAC
jgi:hypothetical protein